MLCEIPYNRSIAEEYAAGNVLAAMNPWLEGLFAELRDNVVSMARAAGAQAAHA